MTKRLQSLEGEVTEFITPPRKRSQKKRYSQERPPVEVEENATTSPPGGKGLPNASLWKNISETNFPKVCRGRNASTSLPRDRKRSRSIGRRRTGSKTTDAAAQPGSSTMTSRRSGPCRRPVLSQNLAKRRSILRPLTLWMT